MKYNNQDTSKPLGEYLREAALLTDAQISVALHDQEATGLLFGEVLAIRGWIDQKTLDVILQWQCNKRLEAWIEKLPEGAVLDSQEFLAIDWSQS